MRFPNEIDTAWFINLLYCCAAVSSVEELRTTIKDFAPRQGILYKPSFLRLYAAKLSEVGNFIPCVLFAFISEIICH